MKNNLIAVSLISIFALQGTTTYACGGGAKPAAVNCPAARNDIEGCKKMNLDAWPACPGYHLTPDGKCRIACRDLLKNSNVRPVALDPDAEALEGIEVDDEI